MDKDKSGEKMDARILVFWKLILDIVVAIFITWSFWVENIRYMMDYSFSVFEVRFRFTFYELPAYAIVDYSTFRSEHCVTPQANDMDVCAWLGVFRIAGMCYFVVCLLVLIMTAFNLVNSMGLMLYCNCATLQRWKFIHYTLPFFYLIAVLLFLLISNIIFLQAPAGKDSEYRGMPLFGVWLMATNFALALLSCVYFLIISGSIRLLEAGSSIQYQALVAKMLEPKSISKVKA